VTRRAWAWLILLVLAISVSSHAPLNAQVIFSGSPQINITSPAPGFSYDAGTSSTVTLSGTGKGLSTCTWTNSLGGSGSAPLAVSGSTTTWSAGSVSLTVGQNLLTVTCSNGAGGTAIRAITVTRAAAGVSCTVTSDGTQSDTQTKVTAAAAGATVCIADGEYTWASQVSWSNKQLTLRGESDCSLSDVTPPITVPLCGTSITFNHSNPGIQAETCSATNFVEIAHLTLRVQSSGNASGMTYVYCNSAGGSPAVAHRIHHVQYDGDSRDGSTNNSGKRWAVTAGLYGLYDHVQFLGQTARAMANISAFPDGNPGSLLYNYHHANPLGTENAVYVEDSFMYSYTWNQANGGTDNYSSRIVFRMSTIYNTDLAVHGFDSQLRSVSTWEWFGNTFIFDTTPAANGFVVEARGGTGFIGLNTVKNMSGGLGFNTFFNLLYYRAASHADAWTTGGLWYAAGPTLNGSGPQAKVYYPTTPWTAYNGSSVLSPTHSYMGYGGTQAHDGNQYAVNTFDSACSRTLTDVSATSGNPVITSTSGAFSSSGSLPDTKASVYSSGLFKPGYVLSCSTTSGNVRITCSGANFETNKDEGRHVSSDQRGTFGGSAQGTRIQTRVSATQVDLVAAPGFTDGTAILMFADPFIISVDSSTQVTMSVPAIANASANGTVTLGCSHQGYPGLDQPGRGSFPEANPGGWPNGGTPKTYTDSEFEALAPIYLVGNQWTTVDSSLNFSSCTNSPHCNPPTGGLTFVSTGGYLKLGRDWYEPSGGLQTNSSTPFNGSTGTGIGTHDNRPTDCTAGVAYWEVDTGSWNQGSFSYVPDHGNGTSYTQGRLYQCTVTGTPGTWTLHYTPYTYPHPLQGS